MQTSIPHYLAVYFMYEYLMTGAYRGIENGGGARFEKRCDNRNEARRAEFAQRWGRAHPPSPKKILKNQTLLDAFSDHFFS